jgi:hypothetical protein
MTKIQNFRQNRFGHLGLKIEIYLGFGICHLEFVITIPSRRNLSGYVELNMPRSLESLF